MIIAAKENVASPDDIELKEDAELKEDVPEADNGKVEAEPEDQDNETPAAESKPAE